MNKERLNIPANLDQDVRDAVRAHQEAIQTLEDQAARNVPVSATKDGKIRRNGPCPCGSRRKFKACCLDKVRDGGYPRINLDGIKKDPPTQRIPPTKKLRKLVEKIQRAIDKGELGEEREECDG
jgi:hypothetical protein